MHFLEQIFGISPDLGNGMTEWFFFLLPVALFLFVICSSRLRGVPRKK